jgi:hypothetical protein
MFKILILAATAAAGIAITSAAHAAELPAADNARYQELNARLRDAKTCAEVTETATQMMDIIKADLPEELGGAKDKPSRDLVAGDYDAFSRGEDHVFPWEGCNAPKVAARAAPAPSAPAQPIPAQPLPAQPMPAQLASAWLAVPVSAHAGGYDADQELADARNATTCRDMQIHAAHAAIAMAGDPAFVAKKAVKENGIDWIVDHDRAIWMRGGQAIFPWAICGDIRSATQKDIATVTQSMADGTLPIISASVYCTASNNGEHSNLCENSEQTAYNELKANWDVIPEASRYYALNWTLNNLTRSSQTGGASAYAYTIMKKAVFAHMDAQQQRAAYQAQVKPHTFQP